MIIHPDYSSKRRRPWDFIAGFVTAILVNIFIVWLTGRARFWHLNNDQENFINLLPWIINGLFLLVFIVLLPRFALGYLTAVAIGIGIPFLSMVLFVAGCFLMFAGISSFEYLTTVSTEWSDESNSFQPPGMTLYFLNNPVLFGMIMLIICSILVILILAGAKAVLVKRKVGEDEEEEG